MSGFKAAGGKISFYHRRIRPWFAEHGIQVLFGVTIILLFTLALWWFEFIRGSIENNYFCGVERLRSHGVITAMTLGGSETEPKAGSYEPMPKFEIIKTDDADDECLELEPKWPGYCLRVKDGVGEELTEKYRRQHIMWIGEGSTVMGLILMLIFMLFRQAEERKRTAKEIDAFVSFATHELKTPIAGVRALLQTMQLGRISADESDTYLNMGLRELNRLDHMVENLLERNRLNRLGVLQVEDGIGLKGLVLNVIEHRIQTASSAAPVFEAAQEMFARADPRSVRTILENLLDNAEKYGEGKPVGLKLVGDGRRSGVEVADDGVGVAVENLESIFKPFFRAEREGRRVSHGSGLGLSISRDLARRMGGDLVVHSDGAGRGCRFTLWLPKSAG